MSRTTIRKPSPARKVSDHTTQPIANVQWVNRDDLNPNDYNPNHVAPVEFDLLKRSILRTGWTAPITVLPSMTIVDGFHRWTVSGDPEVYALTRGLVPIVVVNLSEADRIAATIRLNRARGVHAIMPMVQIVEKMLATGLTHEQVAAELGMEDEEIDRLLEQRGSPAVFGDGREPGKAWIPGTAEA